MPDSVENSPRPAPWRDALLIVLLAPALVAGCYSARFLDYDDIAHYNYETVLPDTPLSGTFRPVMANTYFPITVLSYRFDRWMYESNPPAPWRQSTAAPGVRFNSLLLHVMAGIFLWRALLLLKLGRWMSLFAAAVWTVHPAACESVCWISERKSVLAAFFGFASLWVFFGGMRQVWLRTLATGALFVLAILSKPTAAGFLPVYLVYDLFRISQRPAGATNAGGGAAKFTWLDALPPLLLYAACTGLIVFLAQLNLRMDQASSVKLAGGSLWTVALTDVPILTEYIFNALIPTSLSIFYYNPVVVSLADSFFWTRLAALLFIVAGTLWMSPNRWRTVFLWGWFVGALGPALNIIPIPYLMQDRFAYFSLPAILIIAAETLSQLFVKVQRAGLFKNYSNKNIGASTAIAAALCFALMALLRSGVYRNDLELFGDAIVKQPKSGYAHLHYALTISAAADIGEYSGTGDAATIQATREDARKHLILCSQCGDFDRMLDPGRVRIIIAVLTEKLGHPAEAYPVLVQELKLPQMPYNVAAACQSLARMELLRSRPEAGLVWLDRAIKSLAEPKPSPELLYLKGNCFEKLNRVQDAREVYLAIPAGSLAFNRAQARLKALSAAP